MTLHTEKFARKPFYVDAVQITEGNMQDVAKWCKGKVESTDAGENYIKVRVHRPLNERQTKAFVNDWILFAGSGYKVYTPKAFNQSFERVTDVDEHFDSTVKDEKPDNVRHIFRNASSGEITTQAFAEAHPEITTKETVVDDD